MIRFTKSMIFPENLQDEINKNLKERKLSADTEESYMEVLMISTQGEVIDSNLKLWEVVSIA